MDRSPWQPVLYPLGGHPARVLLLRTNVRLISEHDALDPSDDTADRAGTPRAMLHSAWRKNRHCSEPVSSQNKSDDKKSRWCEPQQKRFLRNWSLAQRARDTWCPEGVANRLCS